MLKIAGLSLTLVSQKMLGWSEQNWIFLNRKNETFWKLFNFFKDFVLKKT